MIPFLQNLIFKDFWLKLFSLALACLIWFTVNIAIKNDISPVASLSLTPTDQLVMREVPILVVSSAEDVRGFLVSPKTVDVTVQGDPVSLRTLRNRDVRVTLDLSDKTALRDSRKRVEVSTPAGISHVKVEPEEVQIAPMPAQ